MPYAFQPQTERGTLPNHLLRGSGRPGTASTRAWRFRRNRAPNLGQVHSAKRACTHACSSRKRRGAGSPAFSKANAGNVEIPYAFQPQTSVEPSRTTCLGVPGRPGTVSTRAWRLRRNPAPKCMPQNGLAPMRVQTANDAAPGAPSHAPSLGMVFKPHSCFL